MKILLMIGLVITLSGCNLNSSEEIKNGRYSLIASSITTGMYRLDTATGQLDWCRPTGTAQDGYRLECIRESR